MIARGKFEYDFIIVGGGSAGSVLAKGTLALPAGDIPATHNVINAFVTRQVLFYLGR